MREMQVLTGMSQGKSNAQIGRELYLSEDTIKTHARRPFRKLAVKGPRRGRRHRVPPRPDELTNLVSLRVAAGACRALRPR